MTHIEDPSASGITPQQADRFFENAATFLCSAPKVEVFPAPTVPEVAFAGRSNVGKSSLLNALCFRNKLAHTSHTPGRTQMINFFSLHDAIRLVDLPGYGYAQASQSKVKSWGRVVERYLKGRTTLRRVFVLVDARHGLKPHDYWVMDLLDDAAQPFQLIFTKCDKASAGDITQHITHAQTELATHPAGHPHIHQTSSHDKIGLSDVRSEILQLSRL